ncbi:MAG: MFS transporter [Bacteroidetes bacterium]|nr:MFS transporter [Bacteroidota bacterium]
MKKGDKKVIRGWVMYDWANSVYQLTIASAIFPIYYNQVTRNGNNDLVSFFGFEIRNTVLYSWAIAAAYLVVAVFSPLFSSIADYTGRRKLFMRIFTWIGSLSCGALFFFTGRNTIEFGVIAFSLGTLGYGGSIVFYNSFLPVIADEKDQDRISARGYAMGYLGGVVLLLFNLLMIMKPVLFGIHDGSLPARISFLSVFVWWIGFSQITFKRLPKYTYGRTKNEGHALWYGYQELVVVFRQVRKSHRLTMFLAGFFFTMMGLLTVMFMAATFGEKELHLTESVLIPTILIIQLVGMMGSWLFARLSERIGNIQALLIAVTIWVFICFGAYLITNAAGFITAAFFIGMVMGGTQSLARSTYSKMIPETKDHTSFFSFYDVMEKLATVAGTFSFGFIEMITGSMRYSILAISVFFILGMVFLFIIYNIERAPLRPSYLTRKK